MACKERTGPFVAGSVTQASVYHYVKYGYLRYLGLLECRKGPVWVGPDPGERGAGAVKIVLHCSYRIATGAASRFLIRWLGYAMPSLINELASTATD